VAVSGRSESESVVVRQINRIGDLLKTKWVEDFVRECEEIVKSGNALLASLLVSADSKNLLRNLESHYETVFLIPLFYAFQVKIQDTYVTTGHLLSAALSNHLGEHDYDVVFFPSAMAVDKNRLSGRIRRNVLPPKSWIANLVSSSRGTVRQSSFLPPTMKPRVFENGKSKRINREVDRLIAGTSSITTNLVRVSEIFAPREQEVTREKSGLVSNAPQPVKDAHSGVVDIQSSLIAMRAAIRGLAGRPQESPDRDSRTDGISIDARDHAVRTALARRLPQMVRGIRPICRDAIMQASRKAIDEVTRPMSLPQSVFAGVGIE